MVGREVNGQQLDNVTRAQQWCMQLSLTALLEQEQQCQTDQGHVVVSANPAPHLLTPLLAALPIERLRARIAFPHQQRVIHIQQEDLPPRARSRAVQHSRAGLPHIRLTRDTVVIAATPKHTARVARATRAPRRRRRAQSHLLFVSACLLPPPSRQAALR